MKIFYYIFGLMLFFSLSLYSSELKITDQAKSQVVCRGSSLELWIDAEGDSLQYEWYFNDDIIQFTNSRIFRIENFDYTRQGSYHCIVRASNMPYELKSSEILIYLDAETLFIKKPENVLFQQDEIAKFETKIHTNQNNNKLVDLQWYYLDSENPNQVNKLKKLKEDNKYSGTKTEILVVSQMNRFDKGLYFCIAEGNCGNDTTFAFLGDNNYFRLKNLSKGYFDCTGGDAVLEVEITNFVGGELEYQWYNPGFKLINESKKFVGTKTPKLTIKNVSMTDNNAYYLKVTHKQSGYYERSEHFYVEPDMLPIITSQPKDYVVLDREANPTHQGQTFVGVFVDNLKPCTFKWYRNDTLVRTTYNIGISDYFLGENYVRPAKKTDVGVYQCEIINECGTTWSKKARVIWGLEEANFCTSSDATLVSDSIAKDSTLYKYFWFFKNQLIVDNARYKNSTTNKLIIKNINESDRGSYYAYLQSNNGGLTYFLGKVYLNVNLIPEITKQLPDTMYLSGKWIKKAPLVVKVKSEILYYQYFNEKNEPISNIYNKKIENLYEDYQIFYHGGSDFTLEDGTYYIKFWNNCGEIKSNLFTISRTEKPVGLVLDSSIISSNFDVIDKESDRIYPNPTRDFIVVQLKDNETIEVTEIEIYTSIGQRFSNKLINSNRDYSHNSIIIDIQNLNNGIYFVKINNSILKFIKIE